MKMLGFEVFVSLGSMFVPNKMNEFVVTFFFLLMTCQVLQSCTFCKKCHQTDYAFRRLTKVEHAKIVPVKPRADIFWISKTRVDVVSNEFISWISKKELMSLKAMPYTYKLIINIYDNKIKIWIIIMIKLIKWILLRDYKY